MEKISWYLEKRHMKGNALKELDAFIDLRRDFPTMLEDSIAGDFGRAHGDHNLARKQAQGCVQMVGAMLRGDTQFGALLEQARSNGIGSPIHDPT